MSNGWLVAVCLAIVALATPAQAGLATPCPADAVRWAEECSASRHVNVIPLECPDGRWMVAVSVGDEAPLRVEIRRGNQGAFRSVGDMGLSPVGEFADWSDVPEASRAAFDRLADCASTIPSLELPMPTPATPNPTRRSVPWILMGGVAAAALMCALSWKAMVGAVRRGSRRKVAVSLAGLVVATFSLRRVVMAPTFFHQNGHGPMWMNDALCGGASSGPSQYGPGFSELFGWVARLRPERPESLVFGFQAALAALGPACAWYVARRVGARPLLAWALAGAVALDPLLARMSFSESYYVAISSLLLLATAIAATGTRTLRTVSASLLISSAIAGAFVAAAARIHPTGWLAASLVPFVHLLGKGSVRRRLAHAAIATAVIGAIVAVTCGGEMLHVLQGGAGQQWTPEWRATVAESVLDVRWGLTLLGSITAWLLVRRKPRAALRVAAIFGVVAVIAVGNMHRGTLGWVQGAYTRMYTAILVAAYASVLASLARRATHTRLAAAATIALALVYDAAHVRWIRYPPTDALELRLALQWRNRLQPGSQVVGLGEAGKRIVDLHAFGTCLDATRFVYSAESTAPPPLMSAMGPHAFYYRSSLCSTPDGRPFCDAVERNTALEPVVTAELPARPSMVGLDYDVAPVRIGLYRVIPRR